MAGGVLLLISSLTSHFLDGAGHHIRLVVGPRLVERIFIQGVAISRNQLAMGGGQLHRLLRHLRDDQEQILLVLAFGRRL